MKRLFLAAILAASSAVLAQTTTVNVAVDLSGITPGTALTPTILNSATVGTNKGTWGYGDGRHSGVDFAPLSSYTSTTLETDSVVRRTSFTVNGVEYNNSNRAIVWDMDRTGVTTDFETVKWFPTLTITTNFTATVTLTFNDTMGGDTLKTVDLLGIWFGGRFAVAQHQRSASGGLGGTAGVIIAHGGTAGGSSNSGHAIPVNVGDVVNLHVRANVTTQLPEVVVINTTTGDVIDVARGGFEPAGGSLTFVQFGNYLTNGDGSYRMKYIAFDWTTAALPLEPITVPTPTLVNVTQIASGEMRLLFRGKGLSYTIRRSPDNSTWTTLTSTFFAPGLASYTDSTVSDGATYYYDITAHIGASSSAPVASAAYTVNNAPSGTESTYLTQGTAGASASVGETATMSQRFKNTLGTTLYVSEIILDTEFFTRGNPEYLLLTENADGTGAVYGVSTAYNITTNGPIPFTFFHPAAVPTGGAYMFYNPIWARTQLFHAGSDVYAPGEGYNGSYNGTGLIYGSTSDLKFTIKQRPPDGGGGGGNGDISAQNITVGTVRLPPP